MASTALSLADQLQLVLDGRISLDNVSDNPENAGEPLASCFHGLQHFLMDEDIRTKDSAYLEMQESEMRKLIALLRQGADGKVLARISFLGRSSVTAF
ncbi:hypothetical protein [Roseateles oligotrophus]|uniref:Uncharacterized protein n=1 Tax=Roseateles oligotrophus TaxID=1769250 RepID=A0ABT2YMX7_9BURK|nr:hypothetical protein [Roseateles oligotrophus]MCV2371413.1 hypothetical protein [Roseateles oligotrophus]